jgi:hypothetical protein
MDSSDQTSRPFDKKAIDDAPAGSITISAEPSARVDLKAFWEWLSRYLERVRAQGISLALVPLRLVLLTNDLGASVKYWQSQLGEPQSGTSEQPEGVAVAKTFFWGEDESSARAVVVIGDHIAYAAMNGYSLAISTVIHEFGHVHDYFLRNVSQGFRRPKTPPGISDWPLIRTYFAEIVWSEYAAESIAAIYMTDEDLRSFEDGDQAYLSGVHERIRERIIDFHSGRCDLGSLWSYCITQLSDVFSNLGRSLARISFAEHPEEAHDRLVSTDDLVGWCPIVKKLATELGILGDKAYSDWPVAAQFRGIEEALVSGFHVVGLFPMYESGNLRVQVR